MLFRIFARAEHVAMGDMSVAIQKFHVPVRITVTVNATFVPFTEAHILE